MIQLSLETAALRIVKHPYAKSEKLDPYFRIFFFDFIPWKPTDTWPRDRCGRAQLVLLPSLVDFLHLGADL